MDHSARVEIQAAEAIFRNEASGLAGYKHISKLLQVIEDSKDVWLCYEVGQQPLSKHLFEVKGEFFHGERIYSVIHKGFYQALATS